MVGWRDGAGWHCDGRAGAAVLALPSNVGVPLVQYRRPRCRLPVVLLNGGGVLWCPRVRIGSGTLHCPCSLCVVCCGWGSVVVCAALLLCGEVRVVHIMNGGCVLCCETVSRFPFPPSSLCVCCHSIVGLCRVFVTVLRHCGIGVMVCVGGRAVVFSVCCQSVMCCGLRNGGGG